MGIKNWQELTLDSETFEGIRNNFDMLLQKLFRKMEQNASDEGSITLKIDVNMVDDSIPDEEGGLHRIKKPVLKHKVTTTVPVKDSFDGKKDTGMEIIYDEELKRYVLKYVSVGGQRSIFDPEYEDVINGTSKDVMDKPDMVTEPLLLERDVEETENGVYGVVDVEYEEIIEEDDRNVADDDKETSQDDYEYEEE